MSQKGAVHLTLPIVALVVVVLFVSSNITTSEKFPQEDVAGVLVAKGDNSGRGGSDNSSGPGSSNEQRSEERSAEGRVKTEIRDDRAKIEVRQEGIKEKIEIRNGIVTIKRELEDEEDLEDEDELEDEEDELEDEEEATESADDEDEAVQDLRAISKFPLRIDTATNQLIMTKNGVERVLTVLPAQAVQNMLRAHLKKGLGPKFFQATSSAEPSPTSEGSPSASPTASASATPEASPSSEPEASESADITILESQIELEEKNGQAVYKIKALKHHRLFGFIPLSTQLTGYVSAETGNLLEETQSLLARLIDLLSP